MVKPSSHAPAPRLGAVFNTSRNGPRRADILCSALTENDSQRHLQKWMNMELSIKLGNSEEKDSHQLLNHIEEAQAAPVRWTVVAFNRKEGTCRGDAVLTTSRIAT